MISQYFGVKTIILYLKVFHPWLVFLGIEEKLFRQLRFKELDSGAEISWDPLPLRQLTASIQGYILSYRDNGKVVSVTTGAATL